jgi:hypothetical protein
VARRRARRPAVADPGWRKLGLMASAFLLLGLGLLVGSLVYRWQVSQRAERLRSEGVAVTATVTDRAGGRGSGADRIEIYYMYGSAQYHTWIPCAGVTGCHDAPRPHMTLWVDPAQPERFVADNGPTDGSLFFLMSWKAIPSGLLLTALGGVPLAIMAHARYTERVEAKQSRRGRRGRAGRRR